MKDRNIRLNELSEAGIVVMLFLSDRCSVPCILTARMACCHEHNVLPEVLGMGDRILVMRDGRIAGELPARSTEQDIMLMATGHSNGQDAGNNASVGKE